MSGTGRAEVGPWLSFLERSRPNLDRQTLPVLLALDPGETTGFSVFVNGALDVAGEWATYDPSDLADNIRAVDHGYRLERIVYEEYRIRGNKAQEHVGSEVVTIQHIGAIKVVADELGVALTKQTAGMAKGFATDNKLRRWSLYQRGKRHANDSIRHACYWILFGTPKAPRTSEGSSGRGG